MKHLFLVLALTFSVCVFSQATPVPVPDDPVAVTYDQSVATPDYFEPAIEVINLNFVAFDYEFNEFIFKQLKKNFMTYGNNFGQALEALKSGGMLKRQCMRENVFIFMQVPSTIDKSVVPRMTSLPDSVKKEFERRCNDEQLQLCGDIHYTDQLAIVDSSNVIRGYSPSVEDALADDWVILD